MHFARVTYVTIFCNIRNVFEQWFLKYPERRQQNSFINESMKGSTFEKIGTDKPELANFTDFLRFSGKNEKAFPCERYVCYDTK